MYIKINKDKIFNIKYNELSVASIIFRLKTLECVDSSKKSGSLFKNLKMKDRFARV